MRGLLALLEAALLLATQDGHGHHVALRRSLRDPGSAPDCGPSDARQNSSWQLVLPDSMHLQPSKFLRIRQYAEAQPAALAGVLTKDLGSLAPLCSAYVGVQFPGFGPAWTKLRPCLSERTSTADVVVVRSNITVAQCASRCQSDAAPLPAYCNALPTGIDSALLPSVILARAGAFERLTSALTRAQTRGGKGRRALSADTARGAAAAAGQSADLAAAAATATWTAAAASETDPLALQCSLEAVVAAAFARSVGGVHFCATATSTAEDTLRHAAEAERAERANLLRWMTGASVAALAAFLLSKAQHLIHAYPTVFSLSLNTVSSVGLIFTNKALYQRGCDYAVTLVGMNYAATSSVNLCVKREGKGDGKGASGLGGLPGSGEIKAIDTIVYVFLACTSLITSNLSLLLNSVGFYQISKLMIIPTSCLLEFFFQGKRYSARILATVVMVLVGVGAATVSDVTLTLGGAVVAFISVVTMSAQQVLVSVIQQKYNMKADAFVAHVAPFQAVILIAVGPFLDRLIVGEWPWELFKEADRAQLPVTLFLVVLSSAVAIVVNVSQAMAIGVASAVAFQVLGHSKTVLILFIAWLAFDSSWSARSLCGAAVALAGIVSYGLIRQRDQAAAAAERGKGSQGGAARLIQVLLEHKTAPTLQPLERSGSGGSIGNAPGGTPKAGGGGF